MNNLVSRPRTILRSFSNFVSEGCGIDLFYYQLQPATAILESVFLNQGLTFVLDFPNQSGKDELLAQLKVYLMRMLNDKDRTIIEVNRCDESQMTAYARLCHRLHKNIFTWGRWNTEGFEFIIDKCRTIFIRVDDITDGRSILADILLIFNDAHEYLPSQYDKKNKQLSARRKVTRVLIGFDWGEDSLMTREREKAILDEQKDGLQRFFRVTGDDVKEEMQKIPVGPGGNKKT